MATYGIDLIMLIMTTKMNLFRMSSIYSGSVMKLQGMVVKENADKDLII